MLTISPAARQAYPDAHAGILEMSELSNPARHEGLEARKAELEQRLRQQYAGQDRRSLLQEPMLQAYDAYYTRFKKTYHVQLQLESILFKNKSIPSVAALVEAMFMAEIEGLLLTAGHDRDALRGLLTLDIARDSETYTLLRGDLQAPKPGDMLIRDEAGIISSIVYGPDQRTQITPATRAAVFTVYGPPGIRPEDIQSQLEQLRDNILVVAPGARLERLDVLAAAAS